jgi:hypothetical protein
VVDTTGVWVHKEEEVRESAQVWMGNSWAWGGG